jgi:magnesium-transporting ATPase (P-type)
MFASAGANFAPSQTAGVIHQISGDGFQLEVCKIHQFESRFQSMSVLARDRATDERFVFAKGSPETIHAHAAEKHAGFDALVKELSLEGFRTIAVAMRRVDSEAEFARLAGAAREESLRGVRLLGLATFTNQLKDDARRLVETLREAEIAVKVITGDNLFVAVQTALALGIVAAGRSVVALEGAKVQPDGSLRAVAVSRDEGGVREEEIVFPNIDDADFEGRALAMDLDFIKRKENLFLRLDCAIFARATPLSKTLIVKKEK